MLNAILPDQYLKVFFTRPCGGNVVYDGRVAVGSV
jgi:hypothetical protein